jgi:hypothetical protein
MERENQMTMIRQQIISIDCMVILLSALWMGCSSGERGAKITRRDLSEANGTVQPTPESPTQVEPGVEKELPSTAPQNPAPVDVPLQNIPTAFSLRSFNRVNATMASLTGVNRLPATVVSIATQDSISTLLPGETKVAEFQGSVQFATYKLASEYCHVMVDSEAARPNILANINLRSPPSQLFTDAGKMTVVKAFTDRFWVLPPSNLNQIQGLLSELITELMAGKNLTTPAQTSAIIKAVCTATLASAPVTFY